MKATNFKISAWVLLALSLLVGYDVESVVVAQPGNAAVTNGEPTGPEAVAAKLAKMSNGELQRYALKLYGEEKFAEALVVYAEILTRTPTNVFAFYNSACVQARLGHPSKAAKLLFNAVACGFIDFERMIHDADLDSVRDEVEYVAIIESRTELRDAAGRRLEDLARQLLGSKAIIERDDAVRMIYGADLAAETFDPMKVDLEAQLKWQAEKLFGGTPNSFVLVLIPTPETAQALIGSTRVGGFYDHDSKRLVTRDLGPSLQHELTHALHHAQEDRLGQKHPIWIQEGLASLFEMYAIDETTGELTVRPNTRLNIVLNLQKISGLSKWSKFFTLSDKKFVGSRPRARYAEAHAIFQFLSEQGVLIKWYETYVAHFAEDATGRLAFMKVFEVEKLSEVERKFRNWIVTKARVPVGVLDSQASLGLWVADQGANDGVEIVGLHPGGTARRSGIVKREVVLAVNGEAVYTVEELIQEVLKYQTGDELTLRLRRGRRYHEMKIKIRPVTQPGRTEILQAPGALV